PRFSCWLASEAVKGYKNVRQGRAPEYFLKNNLVQLIEAEGHHVEVSRIEAESEFTLEIGTAFELNRLLSQAVKSAIAGGRLPLVLAGNCNSCLGSIAGINSDRLGVVWFDAHGEFNTPETTLSGFLDGMPLAIATGRCWKAVAATIPGFAAVRESNVILAGARDLDEEEQRQLEQSEINLVRTPGRNDGEILQLIDAGLSSLQDRVSDIYLHIDMDAFEISEGWANHFGATGGLSVELIEAAIAAIKSRFKVISATIASFDPAGDTNGLFLEAGLRCIRQITS
ncbi:MAG: arginase family protein, partial [Desulfobacterales bacterium]